MNRRTACLLISSTPGVAANLLSSGPPVISRPWIGPDFWSNPLQDWQRRNDRMECTVSGQDRHVFVLTRELSNGPGPALLEMTLGRLPGDNTPLSEGFAGFRVGIKGKFGDYRDSAIYGVGLNAGILHDGRLFIGDAKPGELPVPDFPGKVRLKLEFQPAGSGYSTQLSALDDSGRTLQSVRRANLDRAAVEGGVAVVCSAGPAGISQNDGDRHMTPNGIVMPKRQRQGNFRFWFRDLNIAGDKVSVRPERAFGPILWAMYTVTHNVLKLTAQMAPIGDRSEPVQLQFQRNGRWQSAGASSIDPLARTATFRVADWDARADVRYRVAYEMDGGYFFEGTIRRDPVDKRHIKVAVLSCLNDFGCPHTDLLTAVQHFNPDLLAFEGDQIYERVASYGIERLPLERACLDYLRKWYLFGWSFREVMRDTPSICMPDDHDVFHGNVWGAGGRHAEGTGQPGQDSGGYLEPAAWVNMVQRTQTSHLPDPFDPTPVEQGIGVYYTDLHWGGISFAIIEDRKWKSPPKVMIPSARIVDGWAKNPRYDATADGNVPGAELLGERQLRFLDHWAQDWSDHVWMKVALSQTLFANVATLPPPANTDDVCPKLPIMKAGEYAEHDVLVADHDSNGWPQAGRDAAIRAWRRCAAVHLCGDQHLGSTVQYGVEDWDDGVYALCSPALSNIFPRRWFPPHPGRNALAHSARDTGQYLDGFGNKVTVHAVFNPRQMASQPDLLMDRSPGFAIVDFDQATREIHLAVWPRRIDVRRPDAKPADGWPITIRQLDNGWSSAKWELPPVEANGLRDFCVQVIADPNREIIYTVRVLGNSFAAPVRREGAYSVRVFDPDGTFDKTHSGIQAHPKKA